MVSVVRCWKAEYQKCKHSILLYMHSMIPIICAAIFAGYYHISRWELATKISAYLEVLAVAFPFLIGIIVGLVVQIENQAGHYQLLLGTIPSRTATYIGKLGFLMICAFGATFLALGTFAALYRDAPASLYLKAGILLLITMLPIVIYLILDGTLTGHVEVHEQFGLDPAVDCLHGCVVRRCPGAGHRARNICGQKLVKCF